MEKNRFEIKAPVDWLPAGLVSWYDVSGTPRALVISWIALIGGEGPRARTSWSNRQDCSLVDGGFVVNIPTEEGLVQIRQLMARGRVCFRVDEETGFDLQPGLVAKAPRLVECAVQIECVNAKVHNSGVDTELSGGVVHVHRGHLVIDPKDVADLCSLKPLTPLGV